jgi:hypothetical protein
LRLVWNVLLRLRTVIAAIPTFLLIECTGAKNEKATGAGPVAGQTNKKPQAVRLWPGYEKRRDFLPSITLRT